MAIQTFTVWRERDLVSGQEAVILYHWDDATSPPRVVDIVITNPTSKSIIWDLTSTSNGRTYSGIIPANTAETTITLNNAQAQNRLDITVRPDGKLDGIEKHIQFGE
jgi:hypothetical protein